MSNQVLSLSSAAAAMAREEGKASGTKLEAANPSNRNGSCASLVTSEQMYRITTRLLMSLNDQERVIACSGIATGDLSSRFALHAGLALARLQRGPVLVVDANFGHPQIHELASTSSTPGFSEFLMAEEGAASSMRMTDMAGLEVLTIGDSAHLSPANLSSSALALHFEKLIDYRYVLVDIGEMSSSHRSLAIASSCDVLIATVAVGQRSRKDLARFQSEAKLLKTRFLGVVLTESA
jgi:Mrp family chromosome partitioning ATPase